MATDSNPTAAFWQAIHNFVEHLAAQVHARWDVWAHGHEKRHVHEVVGGLLARQATLACELASSPSIWNAHSAPLFLRSMVENCITIAWILKDPEERAKQFIAYGLGQENLLLEHAKADLREAGADPNEDQAIEAWEQWLNGQRYTFLTEVNVKAVGELYALGVDPFVAAEQTRHGRVVPPAPRGAHTQPSVSQGPDATEATDQAGSATLRFADANCGAGIRPDQAGPGIPAVPAAWTGEGERRMVADLHRPQPAQTVPLWGQSAQESTGRWASPTHQELCRGSKHGAIRKAIWGWPGQPAKLVVAIHCR